MQTPSSTLCSSTLFSKIAKFQIDLEPSTLTFAKRLCRENSWAPDYAERCIDEYKKFVYLAMISEHPVTPSDQVDQVWHLHLTYTRSYWSELCGKILKNPLHHGPTSGGKAESIKYRSQYQATLDLYKQVFEEVPPVDIWPSCQHRFADVDKFVRLNKAKYFLIKKRFRPLMITVALPVLLAACVKADVSSSALGKPLIAVFVLVFFYGVYKLLRSIQKKLSKENPDAFAASTSTGTYVGVSNNIEKTVDGGISSADGGGGDGGCGGCGGCGG